MRISGFYHAKGYLSYEKILKQLLGKLFLQEIKILFKKFISCFFQFYLQLIISMTHSRRSALQIGQASDF